MLPEKINSLDGKHWVALGALLSFLILLGIIKKVTD